MSTNTPPGQNHYDRQPSSTTQKKVKHTKEDALSDREFELLLEATYEMRDYYGFQARFIILVGGRLGLRRGEIAHMKEDWIDWRKQRINIPHHEPCTKGKDGGPCGYCYSLARQSAEIETREALDDLYDQLDELTNPVLEPTRRGLECVVTEEDKIGLAWKPKTDSAVREVPFGHDARAQLIIERFFEQYDEYPCSCQSLNRRVKKAAELAEELDPEDVYPHCLRATCSTRLAGKGMEVIPFKSMLGWSKLDTGLHYIAESGDNTERALHQL